VKSAILAAIDIGSNAVRLLINNVEADNRVYSFKKIAYLRIPLRLGADVFTQRRVSDAKADRLVEAMQGFGHIMRAYAVSGFRACATSAMRDAANGEELVKTIREKAGIDVEIVSGAQEAALIYAAGARAPQTALRDEEEACLHVDVGGGSTEFVVYAEQRMRFHDSFRIGTIRMLNNAVDEAEKTRFTSCLEHIHKKYAPAYLVASGGNINKAYKILDKKAGAPLQIHELETLCATLRALSFEERMRVFGLNDYRADVIVPALEIFIETGKAAASLRGIYVPKVGLVDGLIRDLHEKRMAGRNASGLFHQPEPCLTAGQGEPHERQEYQR
jgi:exopolyphosphatase/guanosine-5'-triphosphate,3'-diphosphate pyrophosphatase